MHLFRKTVEKKGFICKGLLNLKQFDMKKIKLISILFFLLLNFCFGQDTTDVENPPLKQPQQQKTPLNNRIYFGGDVGLTFGNYTRIAVYPLVGYKITHNFSVGLKVGYEYIKDKRYTTTYETSNYGGSVFLRYRIIPQLYVHGEYAMTNYELYNSLGESSRKWVPFLLLGAGFSQSLGGNVYLNIQVLFDVLQNENSPYNRWDPFFSAGIGVGF